MSAIEKVDLGIIRYANCWEDADILLEALREKQRKNIACVASAGDNAIALLSLGCKVTAFDVSVVQLYLTELKKAAFLAFDYNSLLIFLGLKGNGANRKKLFQDVLPHVSTGAALHWKEHEELIFSGIIYQGRFENYFRLFRKFFLPLVHNSKETRKLLEPKSSAEQQEFYWRKWNTRRWKWLMRVFFSRWFMGKYGRDPELLKHVNIPVPEFIMKKASAHLQSPYATDNYLLQMIFTGRFMHSLPFYLREENFDTIKKNIHNLQIVHNAADNMISQPFDAFCLSNIFEYYSAEDFRATVGRWQTKLSAGTLLAFWNLMAPRSFSSFDKSRFREINTNELAEKDKGFFYSRFLLEQKI